MCLSFSQYYGPNLTAGPKNDIRILLEHIDFQFARYLFNADAQ